MIELRRTAAGAGKADPEKQKTQKIPPGMDPGGKSYFINAAKMKSGSSKTKRITMRGPLPMRKV